MMTETELAEVVTRAQAGEKAALSTLLAEARDDVYRLCLRMMGPLDAEDLAQEVLIKVMTHLSEWRREASFRTWTLRIASNHLLNARRGKLEIFSIEMLLEGNKQLVAMDAAALPDIGDEALMAEEVRLACTQAGMLALDRDLRLAFILGYVLELPSELAAEVVGIEPAAFRKRLQRAKDRASDFLLARCGLVNPDAPCRCQKVTRASVAAGAVDPRNRLYSQQRCRTPVRQFSWALDEVKDIETRFRMVARSHPEYLAPETLVTKVREIVENSGYRMLAK